MAHDVFISYSTEDKPAADAVCAILEKNGVRCWIAPRDIVPGADWGESIVNGIRSSKVLLLVFSTNANKSKQIKREVEIAADGGVTIVPLRIENIVPTEAFTYFLGNIHWLDALTPPLEKHLQEVAAKVKSILNTESVSPPEASQPSLQAKAPTIQQPPRRNLLPVIGGIVVVLIATSVLLFFWQWNHAPPAPVRPATPGSAFADRTFYALIVRGGSGVTTNYDQGQLTVTFHKAPVAAGDSTQYHNLPIGAAAWVDRPLNADEPGKLKQRIDARSAQHIMDWLEDENHYWNFSCAYNEAGYFDVSDSKSAGG